MNVRLWLILLAMGVASAAAAQTRGRVTGRVADETGGALPGVTVQLQSEAGGVVETATAASGQYSFDNVAAGRYQLTFTLINFASLSRRDVGATEPGPKSERHGIEWANYFSPRKWLVFDGDVSWSRAYFTDVEPPNRYVPEAVGTVVSAGVSIDNYHRTFASLRIRYFGPRALVDDRSVSSNATTLLNVDGGYQLNRHLRATINVFNLLDAAVSDIDYYFASRLPGEPLGGVNDIHFHPAVPRTARLALMFSF